MSYRLTSTHTFASSTLEDRLFATAPEAWAAAAEDYAASDHGEDPEQQDRSAESLRAQREARSFLLATGERITVTEVPPDPEAQDPLARRGLSLADQQEGLRQMEELAANPPRVSFGSRHEVTKEQMDRWAASAVPGSHPVYLELGDSLPRSRRVEDLQRCYGPAAVEVVRFRDGGWEVFALRALTVAAFTAP